MTPNIEYEPSIAPATFVTNWRQMLSPRSRAPADCQSTSTLSPVVLEETDCSLGRGQASNGGVINAMGINESWAWEDDLLAKGSQRQDIFEGDSSHGRAPTATRILICSICKDLSDRVKGMEEQLQRQNIWNSEMQGSMDALEGILDQYRALQDTIEASGPNMNDPSED